MDVYWPPYCRSREGNWGFFLRAHDPQMVSPDGEVTLFYGSYREWENPVYLEIVYACPPLLINYGISGLFPGYVVGIISQTG